MKNLFKIKHFSGNTVCIYFNGLWIDTCHVSDANRIIKQAIAKARGE